MDPITIAAERLAREHDARWDPPPGAPRRALSVLRIRVAPDFRADAIKALRLLEWRPDNRRPFSIVEAPFVDEATYVAAVAAQLERDVDAVDRGLADDGVARPARPAARGGPNAAGLVAHAEALAEHLAGALDGLVLVLAPKAVSTVDAFVAFARALAGARTASRAAELRIDVLAPQVDGLADVLPEEAAFEVDRDELFDFLEQLGDKPSAGPKVDGPPPLSAEQRAAVERALGQPLVSADAGRTLKSLLLRGNRALAEGRTGEAIKKLKAARVLSEGTGLVREGLLVAVGLGTAYFVAQNLMAAEAAYARAAKRAGELALAPIEAQALFGLGQLRLTQARFDEARPCFERIAALEPEGSPLRGEALRLVEACRRGDPRFGLEQPGGRA